VVVLSRADLIPLADRAAIRTEAERHAAANPLRWAEARHAPVDLIDAEMSSEPVSQLESRKVLAFCGIGNPEGFRRTIAPLCGEIVELKVFPDHHPYTARDVELLREWAMAAGADLVLTTQKDLVKLRISSLGNVPLRALRIGLEVMTGESVLEEVLTPLPPPVC
jgi:tetraacyldisaccharide 4'-kinase